MFLRIQTTNSSVSSTNTEVICSATERQALLSFKKGLKDPKNWLSSWIGEDCRTWKGVSCNNRTGHVDMLDMLDMLDLRQPYQSNLGQFATDMSSPLGGEISSSLLELKHLKYLDLSMKKFDGIRIPEFLGSLKNLRYLNLSYAGFCGMVPPQLGNLSNLHYLDLSTNSLFLSGGATGLHAESLLWLSHLSFLQHLDMSRVNLSKATDYLKVLNMLPSLTVLLLSSCELIPILDLPPPLVSNFTALTIIDLSRNNFKSSVPNWLFSIRGLVSLELHQNALHGPIPGGLQNMTYLMGLDLFDSNFNSTIPDWLYYLRNLITLDVSHNNLTGGFLEIPPRCIANSSLEWLNLGDNHLSGPLPDQLGLFKSIAGLFLGNNLFSGSIPQSIGRLSSLRYLNLNGNQLNGSIPESIGQLSQLEVLFFSYNYSLEGVVSEIHFANLTGLKELDASSNSLILRVNPDWIPPFQLKKIHMGSWQVGIHGELPRTVKLYSFVSLVFLGSNNLEGPLPYFSSNVGQLDLSNNSFSGSISHFLCQEMAKPSFLEILDLSNNLLSGEIPDCWMKWQSLEAIKLSNNNLAGKVIDLVKNEFSGSIPAWLGKSLVKLVVLSLHSNNFSGSIPLELCGLSSLQILDLAHNNLSVRVEDVWLIIKRNELEYSNTLKLLMSMDLSENHLSGEIPKELTSLLRLRSLNLSRNHLNGNILENIPLSTQLQSFNASSFVGNQELCGPPLTQNCTKDGPNNDVRREDEVLARLLMAMPKVGELNPFSLSVGVS
ncbi:receptor-like protein EIX2, partial [Macadamia integrifolia]|uniref:receptor-like protein EIX2 n=1 Tax=Macadamia integrifolia TaxID=60698 RepID=UPI001C4E8E25